MTDQPFQFQPVVFPDPIPILRLGDATSFAIGGGSMTAMIFMSVAAWRVPDGPIDNQGYGRSAGFLGTGSSHAGVCGTCGANGGFLVEKGDGGFKPNAQRFSYSQVMPNKGNIPKQVAKIGGSSHNSASSSSFGEFNGEDEERGYIGFFMETESSYGFGWLDIGYDFESNTLTMYDWAFNDDGDLNAGHGPPPLVPGPTGLLALALGAAGIRRKRNRVA